MRQIDEVIAKFGWMWHDDSIRSPASIEHFKCFESRFACRLPLSYAYFLRAYGGGWFDPSSKGFDEPYVVAPVRQKCPLGDLCMSNVYFGFSKSTPSGLGVYDIRSIHESFLGRLPPDLLAIGNDPGGNLVCISVSGDDEGSVLLWDHEHCELPRRALDADIALLESRGVRIGELDIDMIHYQADLLRDPPSHNKKRGYSNVYLLAPSFEEYLKGLYFWDGD